MSTPKWQSLWFAQLAPAYAVQEPDLSALLGPVGLGPGFSCTAEVADREGDGWTLETTILGREDLSLRKVCHSPMMGQLALESTGFWCLLHFIIAYYKQQ